MTKRLLFAVTILACAALAQAQQLPPGKWWRRPEIIQELQLSADQQEKLDDVFRAAANDLIDTKADVEKLHIAIRGELDRPQLRKAELQRLATQLSAARGRLFERELMMLVDMRGVMSDQQWTRIRNFLDRMENRREGGPMPPRQQGKQPRPNGRRP
ncbi:MAG TPA: periplasmic heavy metal sensor [Thermoanaerobaculia bacterium]|nr:periplasmic heavy metal sensor [Thermoanaerobaculia bacterium]